MDFLRETQTFMDQIDWVERYAWYGVKRDLDGVNEVCCPERNFDRIGSGGENAISAEESRLSASHLQHLEYSLHSVVPSAEPATWVDIGRPLPTYTEVASTDSADYGRPRSTDLNSGKQTLPT
ncbi:hypothetical protein B0H13DRAFT_1879524 [Mycena leptocephala]|nr:hypothetical protein B0H13DRAFT_1879524 [Mycena leptocephala]